MCIYMHIIYIYIYTRVNVISLCVYIYIYICNIHYIISYRSAGEAAEQEVHQELLGRAVRRHDGRVCNAGEENMRPDGRV